MSDPKPVTFDVEKMRQIIARLRELDKMEKALKTPVQKP